MMTWHPFQHGNSSGKASTLYGFMRSNLFAANYVQVNTMLHTLLKHGEKEPQKLCVSVVKYFFA